MNRWCLLDVELDSLDAVVDCEQFVIVTVTISSSNRRVFEERIVMLKTSLFVLSAVLAVPAGVTFVSAAASDAAPVFFADEKVDEGSIKSVDSTAKSFVLTVSGKDVTVRVDANTKYILDGKDSTMAEALKAGYKAKVTHKDGLASKVDATRVTP
jgi:hypothetical protein